MTARGGAGRRALRAGIRYAFGMAALALIAGCGDGEQAPAAASTATAAAPQSIDRVVPAPEAAQSGATPLAERVATLGLLNKRNNLTRDITLKPGESRRVDDVVIRLASCERTAPWESPPETGAFVQLFVQDARAGEQGSAPYRKVFSGWLFLNSPSLNVVEHPIYDVWVKDCAMSFPGEDDAATSAE